jgi:hypothetical protein
MRAKQFEDITGRTYGKLTAVAFHDDSKNHQRWSFRCLCGNVSVMDKSNVMTGTISQCQSCGHKAQGLKATKHGMSRSVEYHTYTNAKSRCRNPKSNVWMYYGGRGIEFRFNSFEEFYKELGPKPEATLTVDRIQNNGHYEPGNVKWSTRSEQMHNTRVTRRTVHTETRNRPKRNESASQVRHFVPDIGRIGNTGNSQQSLGM